VKAIANGEIDVVLFTTSVQLAHLFQIAAEMNLEEAVRQGLGRAIVASIGPTTSEELQRRGIRTDLEPMHPKMGFLVKEAAEQSGELLRRKRQGNASAGSHHLA
jgi:uroporphyrinogen-III synthase